MANSLELRVPFLDDKILEFAARLPSHLKIRGITTKYLAKRALRGRVPKRILARPKTGFPVPYEGWLRREMRNWVHDVLFDRRTTDRGYFDLRAVRDLVARNTTTGGYGKEVFALVTLELWQRTFLDHTPALLT
jgi:asparagine synthase (glutamine-hydrolysing)